MQHESDSSWLHVHLALARVLLDLGFRQSGVAPSQDLAAIAVVGQPKFVRPLVICCLLGIDSTGITPLRGHFSRACREATADGVVRCLDVFLGIDPWPAGGYPLHFLEWLRIFAVRVQ